MTKKEIVKLSDRKRVSDSERERESEKSERE